MTTLRGLQRIGLTGDQLQKCSRNNLFAPKDIIGKSEHELQSIFNCDLFTAKQISIKVSYAIIPEPVTALQIWEEKEQSIDKMLNNNNINNNNNQMLNNNNNINNNNNNNNNQINYIPTGSEEMDQVLNGGIPCGSISEISAQSNMGKSFFCYYWTILFLLKNSGSVCFFDIDQTFSTQRLIQIAKANFPELDEDNEITNNIINNMIERIRIYTPQSALDLIELLLQIEETIIENKVQLIIIDSIVALSNRDKSDLSKRTNTLGKIANSLKYLSQTFSLVVLLTNQLITNQNDSFIPALGTSWAHAVNTRFVLEHPLFKEDEFQIVISKSPNSPVVCFKYKIEDNILKWESNQIFDGKNFWESKYVGSVTRQNFAIRATSQYVPSRLNNN